MATRSWNKLEKLGEGGMGTVYKTQCVEDKEVCAWKELSANASEMHKRRFGREIRIQADLRHPNIMPIIGWNLDFNPPFFVMPLAAGDLGERLPTITGNDAAVARVFRQILAGVAHAHSKGVIHRDLKPGNMLIMPDGRVVVSDFGLSKLMDRDSTTLTVVGKGLGTYIYCAPEQLMDAKEVDHRADIYSLGVVLYQIVTGRSPGKSLTWDSVPAALKYVIQKATKQAPGDRYQSIKEFLADFDLAVNAAASGMFVAPAAAVKTLMATLDGSHASTQALIQSLRAAEHDEDVFKEHVPKIPDVTLAQMAKNFEDDLEWLIQTYDGFVVSVGFEYCDRVAAFYQRVWKFTTSDAIRKVMLARVLDHGYSHNRWNSQDVCVGFLEWIREPATAMMARDVLMENKSAVRHYKSKLLLAKVVPMLKGIIKEIAGGDDEDVHTSAF